MADIAASLGLPVNTAYSRLRLARDEFAAAARRIQKRRGTP
jgi:RNA polymerase sigma-70 factor (ECF subfamily)